MFFLRFLIIAICLHIALTYDINYPTKPSVKVVCNSGDRATYIRIGQKYYLFVLSKITWFDALHQCRRYGGDLALIESAQEMKLISNYLAGHGYDANNWFWISGNDLVTRGKFMSTTNGQPLQFTAWTRNPTNTSVVDQCVHLWLHQGSFKMDNWTCRAKAHFICQRESYTRCWDSNF